MNLDVLREQLSADEGCRFEIYIDHLGLPTFGIGHLIRPADPEHGQPVGTPVSSERVAQVFERDIAVVIEDCHNLYEDFDELPEEAQLIIANMMFNLGLPRLSKFKMMKEAVDARDFVEAANQMVDSKWYRQVPNRAMRLVKRMRSIANAEEA